jgi:peptidyl-prolyl cis-trans isomerase B (cyclophilin B)
MTYMAKKNPFKSVLILSIVTVIAFLVNFFVLIPNKEKAEKAKTKESLLFPEIERADVIELRIENPKGSFQVKKRADAEGQWIVTSDGKEFEGDKTTIEGMISTLLALKKEKPTAETNLAALGLEKPAFKMSILGAKSKGDPVELWVGTDTPVDYYAFAKWGNQEPIFLTSRSLKFSLDKTAFDLRNKRVLKLDIGKIRQIQIKTVGDEKSGPQNLSFSKTDAQSNWVADGLRKKISLDNQEVEKWLGALNGTQVVGFASEDLNQKTQFGFRYPMVTVSFGFEGEDKRLKTETLSLARAQDPRSAEKVKPWKYYLIDSNQNSIFEVSDAFRDNFKVDLFKFRPKKILNFDKPQVTAVTVSDGKSSLEFKRVNDTWTHNAPAEIKVKEFQTEAFIKMFDGLFQARVLSYNDNISSQVAGFSNPTRIVEFRGVKDGQEISLGTLFVGQKVKDRTYYMRSETLDAPATAELDIESLMPLDWTHFVELEQSPKENSTLQAMPTNAPASEGKKKMKLEPTVKSTREIKKLPAAIVKPGHKYTAVMELNTGLVLKIEFYPDKAPYTVSNFLHLARNGFYTNVKFHRVIKDFVVQGGDPDGTGAGGPGYQFNDEPNDLKHLRGVLSMAKRPEPHTNGSQFFIVLKPQPHLDGKHTVFGRLTEGVDKIDDIKQGDFMKMVEVFEEAL